jgi:hypothetical protein
MSAGAVADEGRLVPARRALTDGAAARPAGNMGSNALIGPPTRRKNVMGPEKTVKGSLVAVVLLVSSAWPAPGSADGPRTRAADFIGLWAGVDEDDGSLAQRAITCAPDRTCRVLGAEQFFSTCDDHGGRGIIEGAGTIEDRVLNVPALTLTCPDGASFTLAAIYSLDRGNGTLLEDTDGAPATQILHRLSPRVGSRR